MRPKDRIITVLFFQNIQLEPKQTTEESHWGDNHSSQHQLEMVLDGRNSQVEPN